MTRLRAAILAFGALSMPHQAGALEQEQLACAANLVDPADVSASYEALLEAAIKRTSPPATQAINAAVARCIETQGLSNDLAREYLTFVLSDLFAAEARKGLVEAGFDMDALDRILEIGEGRPSPLPANYSEIQWQAYEAALETQSGNRDSQREFEVAFALYITMSHREEQARRKLS